MARKTVKLACNHCGASLKVGRDTRFVTCTYCDTQLEVVEEDGAAFTRVQEAVERVERQLDVLALEREIDRLDREWDRERETLMVAGKDGTRFVPTRAQSSTLAAVSLVLGLGCSIAVIVIFERLHFMSIFGLVIAAAGIYGSRSFAAALAKYERAEHAYRRARRKLERQLKDAA